MRFVVGGAGDDSVRDSSHHGGLADTRVGQNRDILSILRPELRGPASHARKKNNYMH